MGWTPKPRFDGRRWYVRLKGRQHHLGMTEAAAWARFLELKRELEIAETRGPRPTTVPGLIRDWLETHPVDHHRWCLRDWAIFDPLTPLEDLTHDCIHRYDAYLLHKKNSAQTRRHKLSMMIRLLRHAHKMEWLERLPDIPKLPAVTTEPKDIPIADLSKIFEALNDPRRRYASRILRFILATGCRPGEARLLEWSMVHIPQGMCRLPRHKSAHRGKVRTIYLNPAARAVLEDVAKNGGPCSGYVFVTSRGNPYTASGLRSIIRRLGATPYALRHTFAQHFLDQGHSIDDLRKLIGHSPNSKITQAYAEIRDERALAVSANLAPPLPLGPPSPRTEGSSAPSKKRPRKKKPKTRKSASRRGRSTG